MTPECLAAIHAQTMVVPRPWSVAEFAEILKSSRCILSVHSAGFALGRVVLDEAELLTLAVDPGQQRRGFGLICLNNFHLRALDRGASSAALEVAATNAPARALYQAAGYQEVGMRKAYYRMPAGPRIDAIVMKKDL